MVEALMGSFQRGAAGGGALRRSVARLDDAPGRGFAARVDKATAGMFASAPTPPPGEAASVNLTLVTVICGTLRNVFERGPPAEEADEPLR